METIARFKSPQLAKNEREIL